MMPQPEDDAKTRTYWAEHQIILANERTFSSLMGMGLASVGIAIGFKAVFGDADSTWAAKFVTTLFLYVSIIVFWLARNQARKTLNRLRGRDAEAMPTRNFTLLASVKTFATISVFGVF
jgi:putative membrane protein